MEVRTTEEARQNIERFAYAYMEMLLEKKRVDDAIKELKNEFKEEGVPVGIVAKVLNKIKADKKKTDSERFEIDTIEDWLQSNQNVDDMIGMLTAK